ncbi:HAD superfamily hydrolase (TIGR01509 family) [Frondihabitans sp. PhB188]|uniref:HAD family hydrolase n=1 Tax=Frondihabitans sp. PhB188 TaxID=2485200 RepID=UPI000FA9F4ED|nr:HAD family hydrolase [Frondihabitans sp. PhB188]ROQ40912.1 HAD superfamily hydrolase (TIGR01509 family) [Frondihabitans sp. PhB188]
MTETTSADALLPSAVLWDMDGTLVDTEPYWQQSQVRLVAEHGGSWTRADGDSLIGSGLWHSAKVLQDHGVDLTAQEIIDRMTDDVLVGIRAHLPWRPGARELLREIRDAGIKTALVTMSFRRMAEEIASNIEFQGFDLVVAGDMVENAKPHPEPYLLAAGRLGVDIDLCVAIEDSPTGVASAVAAGAATLGVEHHAPLPHDGAFQHRSTLAGVTLDDLAQFLRQKKKAEAAA